MDSASLYLFWTFGVFAVLIFIAGCYCILLSYNLIRVLIGVELLIKAVTLLLIVAGHLSGHPALAQALVITLIVIEAVFITVAVGVVQGIHRINGSLNTRLLKELKG